MRFYANYTIFNLYSNNYKIIHKKIAIHKKIGFLVVLFVIYN